MGWVARIDPEHRCGVPFMAAAGLGSTWRCEECLASWEYVWEGAVPFWKPTDPSLAEAAFPEQPGDAEAVLRRVTEGN